MEASKEVAIQKNELRFLLETFETIQAELEQLMYDNEWYVTDVLDQITSSVEIVNRRLQGELINVDDTRTG